MDSLWGIRGIIGVGGLLVYSIEFLLTRTGSRERNRQQIVIIIQISGNKLFIHICVWSSEAIQNFSHHHPKTNFDIVEVEKDGVEAVRDILLNSDIRASTYDDFLSIQSSLIGGERVVVIKRLISEARTGWYF